MFYLISIQGKHYMMIEQVSQLYRMLTPVPVWIAYLSDYTDSHWIVSYMLTFIYILAKVSVCMMCPVICVLC